MLRAAATCRRRAGRRVQLPRELRQAEGRGFGVSGPRGSEQGGGERQGAGEHVAGEGSAPQSVFCLFTRWATGRGAAQEKMLTE